MRLTEMTPVQIRMLGGAVDASDLDESAGEALHLLLEPGRCRWVVQTARCELVLDATGADTAAAATDVGWVPVSDRLRRYVEAQGGVVTIGLADDEATSAVSAVTATSGTCSAVIDVVPDSECPEPWTFHAYASAVVEGGELLATLWSARWMPSGLDDTGYPTPPMWMRLADDLLALHVDWSDFVPSRGTYRVATIEQHGDVTVAIPHQMLETFLRVVDTVDDDVEPIPFTIEVGEVIRDGEPIDAMSLSADGWRFTTWTIDPLRTRWARRVRDELDGTDGEVTEQSPTAWALEQDGCVAHVTLHHGHPDVVRVSTRLLEDVEERLDLLRELGALNAAGDGVRFWWEDGAVVAAIDVRCTVLQVLPDAVRDVVGAFRQYAPLLAALGAGD